jgi:prophage tail gpP-like protein
MVLFDGQSELDQVTIKLADGDREIRVLDNYKFNQNFLVPTAGWSFVISTEDTILANQYFVPGARIQIYANGHLQCTGYIDNINKGQSSEQGTKFTISGRDILGPVCDGSLDRISSQIAANMTVEDLLHKILPRFGITVYYLNDNENINVVTGSSNSTAPKTNLKAIPLDKLKGKFGEGAYELIERILSRLGLRMWAACTHDAVVIDKPNFTNAPIHRIIRKKDPLLSYSNNVLSGFANINYQKQPSAVVLEGSGGQGDNANSQLIAIAYNELVSFKADGSMRNNIVDLAAGYPNAKVLDIRKELLPKRDLITKTYAQLPAFIKDDESKTIEQLCQSARKRLSMFQKEYLSCEYELEGHSQNGHPFAVNTMVSVDDDVCDIHQNLWVLDKTFTKSSQGGTRTQLKLILPYTLELGE